MSVYIKGMEMPKPGRYEAVIIVLDESTAEMAISPAEDDIGYWKEYPLVPVPEHGDLIERDGLKELLEIRCIKDNWVYASIAEMPTIITADKE